METKPFIIEPLLEKAENYAKTSLEIVKLGSVDKASDVLSILSSRLILLTVLSLSLITLTLAIALWIGEMLGKNYYGFLMVAVFYAVLSLVIGFIHPSIKGKIRDSLIQKMLS